MNDNIEKNPKIPVDTSLYTDFFNDVEMISLSNIKSEKINWLWYPYIPYGKVTILQGDPGDGKTTLSLAVASILSNGGTFPCTETNIKPSTCIFQTAEDGLADTIKPRLIQHNANCDKILTIVEGVDSLTLDDARIEKAIVKVNAKLLIIDPLQAYLGSNIDMHRANEIRPIFKKLNSVAERTGCAILIIGHMNKASSTSKGIYRGLGSIDISAAARSILVLGRDPENSNIRVMAVQKSSLAQEGKSIAFSLTENGFSWIGQSELTAESILYRKKEVRNVLQDAKSLLKDLLKENSVASKEVMKIANEKNISPRTVKTAKQELNISSSKLNNQWVYNQIEE